MVELAPPHALEPIPRAALVPKRILNTAGRLPTGWVHTRPGMSGVTSCTTASTRGLAETSHNHDGSEPQGARCRSSDGALLIDGPLCAETKRGEQGAADRASGDIAEGGKAPTSTACESIHFSKTSDFSTLSL